MNFFKNLPVVILLLWHMIGASAADAQILLPNVPNRPVNRPLLGNRDAAANRYIVGFRDAASLSDLDMRKGMVRAGLTFVSSLPEIDAAVFAGPMRKPRGSITTADAIVKSLVGPLLAKQIRYVEPDFVWYEMSVPNDPLYPYQWAFPKIGAPAAWDVTSGLASTVVAVIDTGIDYNHLDLRDNVWIDPANGSHGARFINGGFSLDPLDDEGHGTHVSGTVGASTNNGLNVAGVAWSTQLMALKFLDSHGSGYTSDAVSAIAYALNHGAEILSNSWGGGPYSYALYDVINLARTRGIVFIAAAGNAGTNNDVSPFYPASYPLDNIISVAATDFNDGLAWFSNFGATSVNLAAPGVSILSTYPGNSVQYMSGTSMATPHVAGAFALLQALTPQWSYLTRKQYLLDSSEKVAGLAGRVASGGRLNVDRMTHAPVKVTSPTDATVWNSGTQQRVTWSALFQSSACTSADLQFSSNLGATYPITLAERVPIVQGYADIVAPKITTNAAQIAVTCSGTGLRGSSATFSSYTPLAITNPTKTTVWRALHKESVNWDGGVGSGGDPLCAYVQISVSRKSMQKSQILRETAPNSGKAIVKLPFWTLPGRDFRVALNCLGDDQSSTSERFRVKNPIVGIIAVGVVAGAVAAAH